MIAHKTIQGEWKFPDALAKVENPDNAEQTNNRPDDPNTRGTGTLVGMNEVISANIDATSDEDWFRIQSLGSKRNGILTITVLSGHPGVTIFTSSDLIGQPYGDPLIASGRWRS